MPDCSSTASVIFSWTCFRALHSICRCSCRSFSSGSRRPQSHPQWPFHQWSTRSSSQSLTRSIWPWLGWTSGSSCNEVQTSMSFLARRCFWRAWAIWCSAAHHAYRYSHRNACSTFGYRPCRPAHVLDCSLYLPAVPSWYERLLYALTTVRWKNLTYSSSSVRGVGKALWSIRETPRRLGPSYHNRRFSTFLQTRHHRFGSFPHLALQTSARP